MTVVTNRIRTPRLRRNRFVLVVGGLFLVAILPLSSASSEPDPTYPGLPALGSGEFWVASKNAAFSESAKQKQYFRVPSVGLIVSNTAPRVPIDRTCTKTPPYSATIFFENKAYVAPVPAKQADPSEWGRWPEFTVRAVAFGSVPVEVDIQLEQTRDKEGLPVPLMVEQDDSSICPGNIPDEFANYRPYVGGHEFHTPSTKGQVVVGVTGLRVDGVEVDVGERCRAERPIDLDLMGKGYVVNRSGDGYDPVLDKVIPPELTPPNDTAEYFSATYGGRLQGELDVPPFEGCISGEQDMSPLLTASISGPGNEMQTWVGPLTTPAMCPDLYCDLPGDMEFPERP